MTSAFEETKPITLKTPSGRTLITIGNPNLPDVIAITESDFDKSLKGLREIGFSIGCTAEHTPAPQD